MLGKCYKKTGMKEDRLEELKAKLRASFETTLTGAASLHGAHLARIAFAGRGILEAEAVAFFTDPHAYAQAHLPLPDGVDPRFEMWADRVPQLHNELERLIACIRPLTGPQLRPTRR